MAVHPLAGKKATSDSFVNIPRLVADYFHYHPDPEKPGEGISFGTSGHRGTSTEKSFNQDHILAVTQALCDYRKQNGFDGMVFIGKDTHALSEPALITAIEVLAANEVHVRYQQGMGYTPTPAISHAIINQNRGNKKPFSDGIVITPSHNPPEDGGFKYNPPTGGPAGPEITSVIQKRANEILQTNLRDVKRIAIEKAFQSEFVQGYDFITPYVEDLQNVVNLHIVKKKGLRIGIDPMGGAANEYWDVIADFYGLKIEVVNRKVDPQFGFMTLDHDGKIRMDSSSPYAMAGLIGLKDKYDIAFGNDPDVDRHGIVTPTGGLMNPNHYLSVAIWYLFQNRDQWRKDACIGKTMVSSSMIDRVASALNRELAEVPVGFKWFVDGLLDGSFGFGGEESAGASFLRFDGNVWTTDKDGIILNLLAAEILATTGKDPSQLYMDLTRRFGNPIYQRKDAPADSEQKKILSNLNPENVTTKELGGEKILHKLTKAPYNQAPIGGLKVVAENGWFAARPSGTEDIYKIYAESFLGEQHLRQIQEEAQEIVSLALNNQ
ncbi:MAG TPA: phosphoglucomutase (alpha-D-glucose-1,6-bisphosphate-dependent) [Anaerolineaceae bacterium]|nr:phosphoglucomutase (alpha-D-glucose-1,6-bisphosphate-dependent) [Anaerolineaceae bacterium]